MDDAHRPRGRSAGPGLVLRHRQAAGDEGHGDRSAAGRADGARAALDFGCGVGRLTRALSEHFDLACGVDIGPSLVARARVLNSAFPQCCFAVNPAADLRQFADAHFDLVYSELVLQRCPSTGTILSCLEEFVRVTKSSGLVVFQLPSHIPLRQRLQPRRRAYAVLRRLGVGRDILYHSLGLHPVRMNSVAENTLRAELTRMGARVLHAKKRLSRGRSTVAGTSSRNADAGSERSDLKTCSPPVIVGPPWSSPPRAADGKS